MVEESRRREAFKNGNSRGTRRLHRDMEPVESQANSMKIVETISYILVLGTGNILQMKLLLSADFCSMTIAACFQGA